MFRVEDLWFSYAEEDVLRGINLNLERGDRVVLLGGNGCGKSTLLKILDGLIFPKKGRVFWKGKELRPGKIKNFEGEFRRSVVLLFQDVEVMLFNPTVRDEISFGLRQMRIKDIDERVEKWGEKLGISNLFQRSPAELSIGEKKKVALASILALEPEVLLLDEPLSNLDPRSTGEILDLLWEYPATTVVATQNLSLAPELGERAILLSEDHRKIYEGDFKELLSDRELLLRANLLHIHRHRHGRVIHRHFHPHDWE